MSVSDGVVNRAYDDPPETPSHSDSVTEDPLRLTTLPEKVVATSESSMTDLDGKKCEE